MYFSAINIPQYSVNILCILPHGYSMSAERFDFYAKGYRILLVPFKSNEIPFEGTIKQSRTTKNFH